MSPAAANNDRRLVLWLTGGVLLLVILTAIFAPSQREDDPTPTTYNTGTHGAKASFLILTSLGYTVDRSEQSAAQALEHADAPHTTYMLVGPNAPNIKVQKDDYAAIERFLRRGGRVVATGFFGAYFLPGGRTGDSTQMGGNLCTTTPEGNSPYAQAGSVSIYDNTPWSSEEPAVRVDARCGNDAVIVHRPYAHGGEFVWMASSEPISNRGIAQDNNLRLLLAAVGPTSRHVLFDEFYHGEAASTTDYLAGLPMHSLLVQVSLLAVLLVFSFSRRSGPLREPMRLPRTSPLEFAENMGALYQRAGATQPATEAARRRLLSMFIQRCGIPADIARTASSAELAEIVASRFGVDASSLETILDRAANARYEKLRPREALILVRDIDDQIRRLEDVTRPAAVENSITQPLETT